MSEIISDLQLRFHEYFFPPKHHDLDVSRFISFTMFWVSMHLYPVIPFVWLFRCRIYYFRIFICIINVLSVRNIFSVIQLSWNVTSVQMYIIYLVYHLSQKVTQSMLREITKAGCVYHVLKVHFHLTTIKKNMNSMMLYPTYGTLFLKNFSFESLQDQIFNPFEINESTGINKVYLLIMLILIFISLMTHCREIYLRIQIITLRIILISYIAN